MLEKGFLSQKHSFHFPRGRLWIGLVIGLASTFGIYTFFCLFRMIFRVMEFNYGNGPLIFDSASRYAQNLNFAMLSLVLGNALFLGFLFRKPLSTSLPEHKRLGIMNNQVFLGFNFFYVFIKTFVLGGVFIALSYDMEVLSSFTWLYLLISLVLFFESYVWLLRCFRRKAFKTMWINLGLLTILSFLLATTSVFNYKEVDEVLLANNPPVDLAATGFKSERDWFLEKTIKIYYASGKSSFMMDGRFYELHELPHQLVNHDSYREFRSGVLLFVPRNLPMGELVALERQLWQSELQFVLYATKNPEPQFTSRFETKGVKKYVLVPDRETLERENKKLGLPPPTSNKRFWLRREYLLDKEIINIKISDRYYVNGMLTPKESLLTYFKKNINKNTFFNFQYDDSVLFEEFIYAYAAYRQALDELRVDDQLIQRLNDWGPWIDENDKFVDEVEYREDQDRLKQKYPSSYLENYTIE